MKIALVVEKFSARRGGAERSTWELAEALTELGHEVTLLAGSIQFDGSSTPVFSLKEIPAGGVSRVHRWRNFQRELARHLRQTNYDIVHSMTPIMPADVYQPRGGSIRHSSRRHGLSYGNAVIKGLKRATSGWNLSRKAHIDSEKRICTASAGPVVAALSDYVAEQFRADYALDDNRLRVVRSGIQVEPLRSESARQQGRKLRSLYDRQGDLAWFLFAAENLRLKGLGWLIRAAGAAMKQRQDFQRDFRIMVVGGAWARYWRQAQRLGLEQRVLFMGHTQEMSALLNMCDAVVLPTYNDACSRVVLEGLAAGKPAITTRYNGAAEFLGQGRYGCIVDQCDNVDELAAALLRVCDRKEQQRMCQAIEANKLWQQVGMARHARELVQLYQSLIDDCKRGIVVDN